MNKSTRIMVIIAITAALLTGCRTFTRPARVKELSETARWMDFDATRRGGLLLGTNGSYQLVLEPAPDVAVSSVVEFITKANVQGKITAEQTTKITESLTELGKRTSALMLLRESMFRLNQFAASGVLKNTDVTNLFTQIIEVSSKLAQAEVTAEAARPKVEEQAALKAKAEAQVEEAKAKSKAKQLDVMREQLEQINRLDIPPAQKGNLIQQLRPPTE